MKPEGPIARRTDYTVMPCTHAEAAAAVVSWHYAKGCSKTAVAAHALRNQQGELVGAALWLPPTKVAAQSVEPYHWRNVLALSRLVVAPTEPKNAASLLLGQSIRLLPKRWHTLLTYADSRQGHVGTIYKATNWIDLGEVPGGQAWADQTGKQVALRATTSRTVAEMLALGHVRLPPSVKRKFVFRRSRPPPSLMERIRQDYEAALADGGGWGGFSLAQAAHAEEHASAATDQHGRSLAEPAQRSSWVVLAEGRDASAPGSLPPSGLPLALEHDALAGLHEEKSTSTVEERQDG